MIEIKKVIILCLFVFVLTLSVKAEDVTENYNLRYGGGGMMVELLVIDLDNLNNLLKENGFSPLDNTLITYGGNLFSQTNNNFRYSIFGSKGAISSKEGNRNVVFSLIHGGVWLEQIIPLRKSLAISGGLATSLGKITLNLSYSNMERFTDAFNTPFQSIIDTTFAMLKPQIGLYCSLKRYVDLELKVGYFSTFSIGGWKYNNTNLTEDKPANRLQGFSVLLNLNFGF